MKTAHATLWTTNNQMKIQLVQAISKHVQKTFPVQSIFLPLLSQMFETCLDVCVCAVRAHKIVLNENEKMENSLGTLNFII